MLKRTLFTLLLVSSFYGMAEPKEQAQVPLDAFAMLPAIQQAAVSPDGKYLSILRGTSKNGDYIIEVRETKDLQSEPVRLGASRMEITGFNWLNSDKMGVSFRQNIQDGNRNYWVTKYAIINADGSGDWLIPFRKDNAANFSLTSILPDQKDHVLLEYDINNNRIPDVVKLNINTGQTQTVMRGNTKISGGFVPDADGEIRAATGFDPADTSINLYARTKGSDDWKLVYQNKPSDRQTFDFLYFTKENPNEIYVKANKGQDKAGIYIYNIETETFSERLFGLKNVDAGSVILSSKPDTRGQLLGFTYTSKHPERYFVDGNEEALYKAIEDLFKDKYVSIASRSTDDNAMVIQTMSDKDPGSYYLLYQKKKLDFIGERYPLLEPEHLSDVKYITYKARDGLTIPAYVTIPDGKKPFPTVVMPHGGPWARDINVYDEWSQLLAHHGYLVIQPQFRGSQGFGMELWKAGDKQWGMDMQDDLDDAAQFLVEKGLADEDQLAIFGWSYGGYAAFVGSMRDNNIYQCSIAGAGVSDLSRINATLNDNPFLRELQRPTIEGVSPLDQVEKVNIPILVVHGDIDQRVPVEHSDLFVERLEELNKPHKYIRLEGADHFSNTLYYHHKTEFYSGLLDWLDNQCGLGK